MSKTSSSRLDELKSLVPVIVFCISIVVVICIPLKVMSYGYLPPDDALRHAGKVISGKGWDEILVMRPGLGVDYHQGWHSLLGLIHNVSACDQDGLVFFSVFFLFVLLCMIPVLFLEYPEAWLVTLSAIAVFAYNECFRFFLGRPFIFTMAVLLLICFLWPKLKEKKMPSGVMCSLTALIALSTWMHAGWSLYILPAACFFFAREWRAAVRFAFCVAAGTVLGAMATGHPVLFFSQNFNLINFAVNDNGSRRLLVGEFQPFGGSGYMVLFFLGFVLWRALSGKLNKKVFNDPVFLLAIMGWIMGFVAYRFWSDWGFVAALFWISGQLEHTFAASVDRESWARLAMASVIAVTLFLSMTADINSRWTNNLTVEYLSQRDPKQAEWLPEPGGIIYSDDMTIFYRTFFKNPKAPWRYILGFEAAMMPPDDLAIFRKIQWNYHAGKAFEPWVAKMRPGDRLIYTGGAGAKPAVQGLEWYYAATNTWIGRTPKK